MQFQNVISSNLLRVGYNTSARILQVQFKNGMIYRYFEVPEFLYTDLITASSKGTFFDTHIKKGGYRYMRIR